MPAPERKPEWLKVRISAGPNYREVKALLRKLDLHTVCEEAGCPNSFECFESRTATFLILGDRCTRNCSFCKVAPGAPLPPEPREPERVAAAAAGLGLRYVVVTSVTRDDLPDGGAGVFAQTILAIRRRLPGTAVEVLVPDFQGDASSLSTVLAARPDVLNHNIETVPHLYRQVRPGADYRRSLNLLAEAKEAGAHSTGLRAPFRTKSGLMLGLGEEKAQVIGALRDLRGAGCDLLTLGQYLRPSLEHRPVARYVPPQEFAELREAALGMGFSGVEAGPLVRSSYHAAEQASALEKTFPGK